MSDGFIDLRQNRGSAGLNDNFWPSFTDIMMVVVMVFLLTSTILIIRNWELVRELRSSMEAEQQVKELVQTKSEVNATLEEQLAEAQYRNSVLRMQLLRAEEEAKERSQRLAQREERVLALESDLSKARDRLEMVRRQLETLSQHLADSNRSLAQLRADYEARGERLGSVKQQLARSETKRRQQADQLGELRQDKARSNRALESLEEEYADLKAKYDKLVGPARSPVGKTVVAVRYEKAQGKKRIQLKGPSDESYQTVSRKVLEERLDRLKAKHPDDLYIKVVIPEDSGLSYSEAWEFMRGILQEYDYYYQ